MIGGPQVIGCTESQVIGGHQSEHYSAITTASLYHYPFIYEPLTTIVLSSFISKTWFHPRTGYIFKYSTTLLSKFMQDEL